MVMTKGLYRDVMRVMENNMDTTKYLVWDPLRYSLCQMTKSPPPSTADCRGFENYLPPFETYLRYLIQ